MSIMGTAAYEEEIGGQARRLLLRNGEIERFEVQHQIGIFELWDQLYGHGRQPRLSRIKHLKIGYKAIFFIFIFIFFNYLIKSLYNRNIFLHRGIFFSRGLWQNRWHVVIFITITGVHLCPFKMWST